MGPRFCQYPVSAVSSKIIGSLPTEADRKKFKGANLSKVSIEKDIQSLLSTTIDSVFKAASAKNVRVLDTSTHQAKDGHSKRTDKLNDVGIYLNKPMAVKATTMDTTGKEKNTKREEKSAIKDTKAAEPTHVDLRSWHWLAIPIEVKHNLSHTAFSFSKTPPAAASSSSANTTDQNSTTNTPKAEPFIRDTASGWEAVEQFVEYMLNVFDNQHRRFSYAIYVWDHLARLCYFDRGGGVISEEFDWTTPESPLHDFLWKMAQMSDAELGYDETVELASKAEATMFKALAKDSAVHETIRSFVKQATPDGQPIYRVDIMPMAAPPDEGFPDDPFPPPPPPDPSSCAQDPPSSSPPATPKARSFLIGKAHFSSTSLVGRCTRGYAAYDIVGRRLCFLKDYWRPYVPNRTRPEHLVYERMASCGVRGVPTLICGGDVGGMRAQRTQIQDLLYHLETAPPVPRIHYRMATVEIGLPLESFTNFRQLALVFADAVRAHYEAWQLAKVLHRDISIGNILIDPYTLKGILIDWDLSRVLCELASGPVEPDHTDTWQFRSALAVNFPRKPYRLSDDLESFIHAFDFLVLKHHPIVDNALQELVTSTYQSYTVVRGIKLGGRAKLRQMQLVEPPYQVDDNAVLQMIVNQLHEGCYKSYRNIDLARMRTLYGISIPKEPPRPPVPIVPQTDTASPAADAREAIPLPPDSDEDMDEQLPSPHTTTVDDGKVLQSFKSGTTSAGGGGGGTPASDPCKLKGFLSHHGYLDQVFRLYENQKARNDKYDDRFALREKAEQAPIELLICPHSHNIGSMSISTGSDLQPVLGHVNVDTSVARLMPELFWLSGKPVAREKRRRQDEDTGNMSPKDVEPARLSVKQRMMKKGESSRSRLNAGG